MTLTIAVSGKGGVGKSTISALLVMALAEKSGEVVLAVDADPNSNLGDKLGVRVEKTLGDLREDLLKKADEIPAGTSKQEFVKYQIQLAMMEGSSFDLLTMGRPEGPGCYCYINNILRVFLDALVDEYEFVIIDNEAGMEHLSRRTTRKMDVLILVSDPTKVGVETAVRLHDLAREMEIKIGRTMLVVNKVAGELHPAASKLIDEAGFDEVIMLPFDSRIEELSFSGAPLTKLDHSSSTYRQIEGIVRRIRS